MASYNLEVTKSAQKDIRKLPRTIIRRVNNKIQNLRLVPRPADCEKLSGSKSSYRVRVGDYRIIYTIYDAKIIVSIIRVAHRKDVYRKV